MTTRAGNYDRYKGEWQWKDGIQTVSIQSIDAFDNPLITGIKGRWSLPISDTVHSAGAMGGDIEQTGVQWTIWHETCDGYKPKRGDTLTDEDGTKWTIGEDVKLLRWGTQWQFSSKQTVEP